MCNPPCSFPSCFVFVFICFFLPILKLGDMKKVLKVDTTATALQFQSSTSPHPLLSSPRISKRWTPEEILRVAPSIATVQVKLNQFFKQWISNKNTADMMDEWLGKELLVKKHVALVFRVRVCFVAFVSFCLGFVCMLLRNFQH